MNKMKRLICLALAGGMLLLAACGNKSASSSGASSGTETKGKYIEKDITPPNFKGSEIHSFKLPDGKLVVYDQGMKTRYESSDGGDSWKETPGPGSSNPDFEKNAAYSMAEDGTLFYGFYEKPKDENLPPIGKIAPDGTISPYKVEKYDQLAADGKNPGVTELMALPEGRLLISIATGGMMPEEEQTTEKSNASEGTTDQAPENNAEEASEAESSSTGGFPEFMQYVQLLDQNTGELVKELSNFMTFTQAAAGDKLYVMDFEGSISTINIKDGSEGEKLKEGFNLSEMNFFIGMASDGEENLYFVDSRGIQKLNKNGNTPAEQILDGLNYSIGEPNAIIGNMDVLQDKSFVIGLMNGEEAKLYKYTWDENASTNPDSVLNVWSLENNQLIRAAISAFRKKHPEVQVNYEVALSDEGMSAQDAIQNLNTRLLAGDGPDIMMLDGAPLASYGDKGMLADLTDLLELGDVYDPVKNAFKNDKGLYAMPTGFKVPVLVGPSSDVEGAKTLDNLVEMIEKGQDVPVLGAENSMDGLPEDKKPVLSPGKRSEILDLLWQSSASEIVTKDGVNRENLTKFLNAAKAISDRYKMNDWGENGNSGGAIMLSSGGSSMTMLEGSLFEYMAQRARMGAGITNDMQALGYISSVPGTQYASFPGLVEGSWVPTGIMGINNESAQKELAAEFINTMLSADVQGIAGMGSLPVTKQGIEKQIEIVNKAAEDMNLDDMKLDVNPILELMKNVQVIDTTLKDKIFEAAESYCKGESDLEGTIENVEQNLSNYLAERR